MIAYCITLTNNGRVTKQWLRNYTPRNSKKTSRFYKKPLALNILFCRRRVQENVFIRKGGLLERVVYAFNYSRFGGFIAEGDSWEGALRAFTVTVWSRSFINIPVIIEKESYGFILC